MSSRARRIYVGCVAGAFAAIVPIALDAPWALLAFLPAPLAFVTVRAMLGRLDAGCPGRVSSSRPPASSS